MNPLYRRIDVCRSCGSEALAVMLDLGEHALSTFTATPAEHKDRAPLVMVRCGTCALVQLRHTVDRDRLYSHYFYRSGTNETMVAALKDVVEDACSRVHLEPGDTVLDIGANDGTLLRQYPMRTLKVAVEPSPDFTDALKSVAEVVIADYFPPRHPLAVGFRARVITSCAQFYNVEDPNEYVAAIKRILHPDGVWMVQMQDLGSVLEDRAFDYVCHEHLALWDAGSFDRLLANHGLEIADVSGNSVNGGSLRFTVMHGNRRYKGSAGNYAVENWTAFRRDVLEMRTATMALLRDIKDDGYKIGALAASTKGNTTLQFYGIGPDLVPWIADRNPDKVGTYTPTGQKVISEEEGRALKPDYLLCLAWHFLDSFMEREAELLKQGTKLIVPLPRLRIIIDGDLPLAKAA